MDESLIEDLEYFQALVSCRWKLRIQFQPTKE